jgi:hypothetical protein
MAKRAAWSTPLRRPINIPRVMTLKTLADVRTSLNVGSGVNKLVCEQSSFENGGVFTDILHKLGRHVCTQRRIIFVSYVKGVNGLPPFTRRR